MRLLVEVSLITAAAVFGAIALTLLVAKVFDPNGTWPIGEGMLMLVVLVAALVGAAILSLIRFDDHRRTRRA